MPRPHLEFIESQEVEETPAEAPFDGASERRLSTDEETAAYTSLMEIPAGRSIELGGSNRPFELFGLGGELTLGEERFGPGCYVYLESGLSSATLTAVDDALLLVMVENERGPGPTSAWEINDTEQMSYQTTEFDNQITPGLVMKILRIDPELGDWTWVAAGAPNRVTPLREIHSTVEEAFLIRGDCLLGEHGEMTPGSYFWRPGLVRHGPMSTRSGTL